MKLPEPARTLWTRHRGAIERVATANGAESRIMLGGGSVLAARWNHRKSTDIDVLLPDRESLNDAGANGPLDLAAATGGTHAGTTREQVRIKLETGKLDVATIKPQIPGLEEQLEVEGRTETVLASAQILRGKFNRTDKAVTRDAFDITVAAKEEPRALEIAVNSLDADETRIACHNLLTANDRMVEDAKRSLSGVGAEHVNHLKQVGDDAADAMLAHRYEHVRVRCTEKGVRIETLTKGGNSRNEDYAGRAGEALTGSGIGAYLSANSTLQRGTLAATTDKLNAAGWRGTIFDSNDGAPEQRVADAREAAGLSNVIQIWSTTSRG